MFSEQDVIGRMESVADQWETLQDNRVIFLRCYCMMTENMLKATNDRRFEDNNWVYHLLHRFAEYYFDALSCYDCGEDLPLVWLNVHHAAKEKTLHVLQHLLLGMNAHINYDLVLTLHELLNPVWKDLTEQERQLRYLDHCQVNQIISETIDEVQDSIVEKYAPGMNVIDHLMGRFDEFLLLNLITRWREKVWHNALALLNYKEPRQKETFIKQLEHQVNDNARWFGI